MQIRVTFRHTDSTDALKSYASEKVDKVSKLLIKPTSADIVLSVEKNRHKAEVLVHALGGDVIKGVEEGEDMYSAIDKVVDKLTRQAKKIKDRVKKNSRTVSARYRVVAPLAGSPMPEVGNPEITESELMSAPPMTLEEAIGELLDSGRDFIVFTNRATATVNCCYRRFDGLFGLCQPDVDRQANGTVPFRFETYSVEDDTAGRHQLVGGKDVDVSTMTVDQALAQMNESKNDFWVFTNEGSDYVDVVYRLPEEQGSYGLIEAFAAIS